MHKDTTLPAADKALRDDVRAALRELADPTRAEDMRRYMKSKMPFYGVQTPRRRSAMRAIFKARAPLEFDAWRDTVLLLWRGARHREERYAAIDLIGWKPALRHHVWEALPTVEECGVTGAWWDMVDALTQPLGNILRLEPQRMRALMLEWAEDGDMWKRRSAILCQLRFKEDLDFDFLRRCIAPSMDSKEFFLRKGIGWALRDHAWTRPHEVKAYVEENAHRLSGLSRREALKHMHKLL